VTVSAGGGASKDRSLGMSLTMLPSVIGYLIVAWLFFAGG
jgi:hypothetical protein